MLTRNEINDTMLPKAALEKDIERAQMENKAANNIIKKSIMRNSQEIGLYLPNTLKLKPKPQPFLPKVEPRIKKLPPKPVDTSVGTPKMNLDNIFANIQSHECAQILAKKKEAFENIENICKNDNTGYNIRYLRSLNEIIKDVKENKKKYEKNKTEKIKKYLQHAIEKKINPKSLEMLYSIEKGRDNIHLQKLILNVEYKDVMGRRKKREDKVNYVLGEMVFNQVKERMMNKRNLKNKSVTLNLADDSDTKGEAEGEEEEEEAEKEESQEESEEEPYEKEESKIKTSLKLKKENPTQKNKSKVMITLPKVKKSSRSRDLSYQQKSHSPQVKKRGVEFEKEKFVKRFNHMNKLIKSEELRHFQNKVLTVEEIAKLKKDSEDILMQKLKLDYIDEYNRYVDLRNFNLTKKRNLKKFKNLKNIASSEFYKGEEIKKMNPEVFSPKLTIKRKLNEVLDMTLFKSPIYYKIEGINFNL